MTQRRGARSGASTRVALDIANRWRELRALWRAVNDDPSFTHEMVSTEFFDAIGDLLEGKTIAQLRLRLINRDKIYAILSE